MQHSVQGTPRPAYKDLFLRQSYLDCYDEYEKSLCLKNYPLWDYVILTASNEDQALAYTAQIQSRLQSGRLPEKTHYAVLPDPEGKRVGSGGATLNVLRYIAEREGKCDFENLKILVIHSGGDSKRVPQYSVCGKLFSPVPRTLRCANRSTLFDEFIIALSGVPGRISSGLLACSGDVLLLFNPLQIDYFAHGAMGLSIKESVHTGKNHGVFLSDAEGRVSRFLHKQTEESLRAMGAVDSNDQVDIDTGAILFESGMLRDLYSLIDTPEKYDFMVSEQTRLSLYGDFLYPLAAASTLEEYYLEKPEGDWTEELRRARQLIWETLHAYPLKLIRFSPASFIHFGTTHELLELMTEEMDQYRFLDWSAYINTNLTQPGCAASNVYVSPASQVGEGTYLEDCEILSGTKIGCGCVISGVSLSNVTVPDHTVLHGLKLKDGRFVARMYGVDDNPKEAKLFGKEIDMPLWSAPLYPACATMDEAVSKTLEGSKEGGLFSLQESFRQADVTAILPWQSRVNAQIQSAAFLAAIDRQESADAVRKIFDGGVTQNVRDMLLNAAEACDTQTLEGFSRKIRIYYFLAQVTDKENLMNRCFSTICETILRSAVEGLEYREDYKIARDEVITRLPVRVNWGGGWSDTPPYCMEHGGTVLNAALLLNGELPIEVTLRRIDRPVIALASTDIGSYKEFTRIEELQDCRNPGDAFALHKAALIACGVIPYREKIEVSEILERLGGGIYFNTRVINIPKGSGLGTSSILSGACVKGIYELLNLSPDDNEIYNRVLCVEQLMSTGGGWQDQVGGLEAGVKMVSSDRGLAQKIRCVPLRLTDETLAELRERFVLIYTGQRRLARNLLREVVGRYIGNDPVSIQTHYEIQRKAVLMRFELEKGNIDAFAHLLNEHWELSQKLDRGCTNTCIDQILLSVEDLIDGRMICGAGGGGFLQVILKKGVGIDAIRKRIKEVFADSGAAVWACDFWMN